MKASNTRLTLTLHRFFRLRRSALRPGNSQSRISRMMHTYVSPVLAGSALMKKYKDEPVTTRFHLHVMAIEVMTLRKLNRLDQLKVIDQDYRNGPDAAYRRAWEIVNDIEGPERFIEELKALSKPQK